MAAPIEIVDKNLGMSILRGIPQIGIGGGKGKQKDILLRKQHKLMFETGIKAANKGSRVCFTGNPGIGKTLSTSYLIRSLLEQDVCTVIYHMRGDDVYYFFTSTTDGKYTAEVHTSEIVNINRNILFRSKKNAYVVDANQGVHGSCNPTLRVEARVFIVASHNAVHWGRHHTPRTYTPHLGRQTHR